MALDVGIGTAMAAAIAAWHPAHWIAPFCAAVCVAAYGVWGIADREIGERAAAGGSVIVTTLRIARLVAAATGAFAAVGLLFAVLGIALGTWIS